MMPGTTSVKLKRCVYVNTVRGVITFRCLKGLSHQFESV
jgi:hypothetical protein